MTNAREPSDAPELRSTKEPEDYPSPERKDRARQRKRRIGAPLASVLLVGSLLLAGGATYYFIWANEQKAEATERLSAANLVLEKQEQRKAEQKRIADAAAAKAAAEALRLKQEEQDMASLGFQPAGNGLYIRWADSSEFTCGYWDCAAIYLLTGSKSCPTSVYVEANIMSGATAVGLTNGIVGGLAPYSSATVMLEDYVGGGSGFQITAVNCY